MEHKSKLNIYLVEPANDFVEINIKTVPLGVGYVGAYCKHQFNDDVDLSVFRLLKPLLKKIENGELPDIVGIGCYDWNYNLSRKAAALIKEMVPECVIVLGGARIEYDMESNRVFLQENPFIDFLIFGDGELAFSTIVQLMMKYHDKTECINIVKSIPIDGVRTLNGKGIVAGSPFNTVEDLSVIPSPYLSGFLDQFLNDLQLMPIIQNIRGCPFKCGFCVSGRQSSKFRNFSFERINHEIDYIRCHSKNKSLRFADDNFGILSGDLEVAKYLRYSLDTYKYPAVLKMLTSKVTNDRTRQIAKILEPLTLMNLSFQTLTSSVLKNIRRSEISDSEIRKNLEFARRNGIATGSTLIFCLPGESLESFKTTLDKTFEYRIDSIAFGVLWLLKGSEVATKSIREQYQYRSKFMLSENAITYFNGLFSLEAEEIAISSKDISFDDWKTGLQYRCFVDMMVYNGYARELLYHGLTFNIKLTDVIQELFDNPEKYPIINKACIEYRETYLGLMFDTEEDLHKHVKGKIDEMRENEESVELLGQNRMSYPLLTRLFFDDPGCGVFDEIADCILDLYKGSKSDLFCELTHHLKDLTIKLIVNPKIQFEEEVVFQSGYNIKKWVEDGCINQLWDYSLAKSKNYFLRSRNSETVKYAIKLNEKNRKTCFYFFRYLNSSHRRRVLYEK